MPGRTDALLHSPGMGPDRPTLVWRATPGNVLASAGRRRASQQRPAWIPPRRRQYSTRPGRRGLATICQERAQGQAIYRPPPRIGGPEPASSQPPGIGGGFGQRPNIGQGPGAAGPVFPRFRPHALILAGGAVASVHRAFQRFRRPSPAPDWRTGWEEIGPETFPAWEIGLESVSFRPIALFRSAARLCKIGWSETPDRVSFPHATGTRCVKTGRQIATTYARTGRTIAIRPVTTGRAG